jgi:hypothetical protein
MVRMVDNLDLFARAKDQQCTMRRRREFKFALGCSCTVFQEVCSKASVVNNYEDNSWAFVVITCLFA